MLFWVVRCADTKNKRCYFPPKNKVKKTRKEYIRSLKKDSNEKEPLLVCISEVNQLFSPPLARLFSEEEGGGDEEPSSFCFRLFMYSVCGHRYIL